METNYPAPGIPVKGVLRSDDVSSKTAINLFREDDATSYTLANDEYLVVTSMTITARGSGHLDVFFDNDGNASAADSEIIYAGDMGTNAAAEIAVPGYGGQHSGLRGQNGGVSSVIGDSAVGVDIVLEGFVRRDVSKSAPV